MSIWLNNSFHQSVPVENFALHVFIDRQAHEGAVILPYVGWIGHRNVGDDVVFDVFCNLVAYHLEEQDRVSLCFIRDIQTADEVPVIPWEGCLGAILGGGSTVDKHYIEKLIPAFDRNLPIFCFASGYQNDFDLSQYERDLIGRLRAARFGSVRGQETRKVLQSLCGEVHVPALVDGGYLAPAFFNANRLSAKSAHAAAKIADGGRRLAAINVLDETYAADAAIAVIDCYGDRYGFVLIPFDEAGLNVLLRIQQAVGPHVPTIVEQDFTDYGQVLSWYSACDFAVSQKLHASVLCSAVGTPSIGWGGGRKLDEYFASIDSCHFRELSLWQSDLLAKVEVVRQARAGYSHLHHGRLPDALASHLRAVQDLFESPVIKNRLARLSGAGLTVYGLQGIDTGYLVIAQGTARSLS